MLPPTTWLHWALLSALFAALTAIFAKLGLKNIDSDFATLIRTLIILFILAAFVTTTGKWTDPFSLSPKTWLFLTLSALATGASWLCYFRALQLGDASQVAAIDKLSLPLIALFALLFLHERPTLQQWTGILLVATGVILLSFKR